MTQKIPKIDGSDPFGLKASFSKDDDSNPDSTDFRMSRFEQFYPFQKMTTWVEYENKHTFSEEPAPKSVKSPPKKRKVRSKKEIREDLTTLIQESGVRLYFEVLREHVQLKKNDFEQIVHEIEKFGNVLNKTIVLGKGQIKVEDPFYEYTLTNSQETKSKVKSEAQSPKSLKKVKSDKVKLEVQSNIATKESNLDKRDISVPNNSPEPSSETNTSDVIKKIIYTLIGEQPKKKWLTNWNRIDRQIFWLIMSKIWTFSCDWQSELNYSSDFPRSKGKVALGANPQFSFYEKKVVKEMLNLIYYDYQKKLMATEGIRVSQIPQNFDFLFEEIGCDEKLEEYVRRILESYVTFTRKNDRKEINLNRLIKMQEINAVIQILSLQPNMLQHFDLTTKLYIKNRNYSKSQMVVVIQRIASAIKKLRELILTGKFPMQGIRLNLDQITIMKQIHIFKPILFWELCFQRILHKLTSNSMDI